MANVREHLRKVNTMNDDMLQTLEAIYANVNRLAGQVQDDQWNAKTPCSDWDTRALVNHIAGTCESLGMAAARMEPTSTPNDEHLGDDPLGSLSAAMAKNFAAWSAEGALDGTVVVFGDTPAIAALGINILDTGTHCWDLAQAIGVDHGLTDGQIAMIDQWNRQIIGDDVRAGGGFGTILEPGDDEPLTNMLAFVGRQA